MRAQPRAHALRFNVVQGRESARQGQIEPHIQPMLAVMFGMELLHRLGHLRSDGDEMGHSCRLQIRNHDLMDFCAESLKLRQQRLAGHDDLRCRVTEPGPEYTHPQPLDLRRIPPVERGQRLEEGQRIAGVRAGHHRIAQRGIRHTGRQRPNVRDAPIQRRRAEFADAPIRRLQPHHTAKRRRDTNRAAAVSADGDGT